MKNKFFKYNRSDFKPLAVKLHHCDVRISFFEDRVEGFIKLKMTARKSINKVTLDARGLDIVSITTDKGLPLIYDYEKAENKLVVSLGRTIRAGTVFYIKADVVCHPTGNMLEGIYRDTTPPGCPQQYMSQIQQWGFQRVLPIFDDCTAKCTFRTTLEGDARYTHLITNGNICKDTNPKGIPILKPGDASRKVITYVNDIPMAPYLTLFCAGTWDCLKDSFVYPSGREVQLEYLVPPGRRKGARLPMQILKESMAWHARTQDYEYPRDVYRTICMEKSNFGGMENVGNTTIVTDAAMIDEFTTDSRLEYAHGVILHEFEHNQCGSDVTMQTPFDIWLNEAYTVDVERQFHRHQFNPASARLKEVDSIRAPIGGPLSVEDAGKQGRIVREGFNDPDEMIDGVTYVKGAEVIGMLRSIIGTKAFKQGKLAYFKKYNGSNANTDQFFACFEKASGRDLSQFKKEWLFTIGYPMVKASYTYNSAKKNISMDFTQKRTGKGGCFHIPIRIGGMDEKNAEIKKLDRIIELKEEHLTVEVGKCPKPAFMSMNRNYSFYGTFENRSETREQMLLKIENDSDLFSRVEALRSITDLERIKLIHNIELAPSEEWLNVYGKIISMRNLNPAIKAYLLSVDEMSLDRSMIPKYRQRYFARSKLMQAVADRHMNQLTDLFLSVDTYKKSKRPEDGIENRKLKSVILRMIIEADTPQAQQLAETHFRKAWNITDKLSALSCIYISSHPDKKRMMEEAYETWKIHLSAYTSYLSIIGTGKSDDVFGMIKREESRSTFRTDHPTYIRPLYSSMVNNNKMLWTEDGLNWLRHTIIKLSGVNEMLAGRLVSCCQQARNMEIGLKPKVVKTLGLILDGIDRKKCPSLSGIINEFL